MARQAAEFIHAMQRPVSSLVCSPLQRTRESAEPFVEVFGIEAVVDERVIEPTNVFEGKRMVRALVNPWNWRHLRKPALPSSRDFSQARDAHAPGQFSPLRRG